MRLSRKKRIKNESYSKRLRERAEGFINKNPSAIKQVPPGDVKELIEDLQIHQVELEMQNEELRRAQLELEAARDKYSSLYDFAPVGYFTIDDKGIILEANLTLASMLGVERGLMIGKPFSRFVNRDDQDIYYLHRRKLFETQEPQVCEMRMVSKDGSQFWARMEAAVALDGEAQAVCRAALSDITERKQVEERLRASLREKEVLLQEIHHRVKNNLQVISSLLRLQSARIDDPHTLGVLTESRDRVRSMALVHEMLYQSENLAQVDFGAYVRNLTGYLIRAYRTSSTRVALRSDVQDVTLGIDLAVPCGLIINELVSNALKHGFPDGRKGEITVKMRADSSTITLMVSDDGVGLPDGLEWQRTDSLGLQLVVMLVEQLEGGIELESNAETVFRITFPRPAREEGV